MEVRYIRLTFNNVDAQEATAMTEDAAWALASAAADVPDVVAAVEVVEGVEA